MNVIKSELYKLKHTWVPWIHILLPIIYALLFWGAAKVTTLKNFSIAVIYQSYASILGGLLPTIIGLLTAKMIDMEFEAGRFQVLLAGTKRRSQSYLGKLSVLLLGGFVAITLSIGIFALLFGNQTLADGVAEIFFLFVGIISVYLIHLWLSLAISGSASIGLGFIEMLLAFLCLTGLGDKIWYFLPCAWPTRLTSTFLLSKQMTDQSLMYTELIKWSYVAIPMLLVLMIGSLAWFKWWNGRTINE